MLYFILSIDINFKLKSIENFPLDKLNGSIIE